MNFINTYQNIIATLELSAGNESVGNIWIETKSFPKETTIEEVMKWADKIGNYHCTGKLIITIDQ